MSPVPHSELTPPGLVSELLFQPHLLYRAPEHKKSCKALTLLQLNLKILLPSTLTLFHCMEWGGRFYSLQMKEKTAQ